MSNLLQAVTGGKMFEIKQTFRLMHIASWRKLQAAALALALIMPAFTIMPAGAKPEVIEWIKYLNPVPDKTYLNESQDRLIKKKKFKLDKLPDTQPVANKEQGFFAIVEPADATDSEKLDNLLSRPDVNGLSVIIPWSLLTTQEDDYDWKPLDNLLSACEKHNKTLIARVSTCGIDLKPGLDPSELPAAEKSAEDVTSGESGNAATSADYNQPEASESKPADTAASGKTTGEGAGEATVRNSTEANEKKNRSKEPTFTPEDNTALFDYSDTPKWAFEKGIKSIRYVGKDGKLHLMPIFWDKTYLAIWSNFIEDLAERYDKNPNFHSIGITGGGVAGGTGVVPDLISRSEGETDSKFKSRSKKNVKELTSKLKEGYGMNQRQLVEHWKYVADLFLNAFPNARLNFDIDPPTPNRKGQDSLDEISDYLIYRYGQRVYLTRQNVKSGKHGFDQYRVLLKFKPDTITGLRLEDGIPLKDFKKLAQSTLDDGVSFLELPQSVLSSEDAEIKAFLETMGSHIGYQLLSRQADFPDKSESGKPLTAKFTFVNLGAAAPIRPIRNLDKDIASSMRIQIELENSKGKPAVISLHTPDIPTNFWMAGKPVTWEEELKMPELAPGKYKLFMSVVDDEHKRTISFLDAISGGDPTITKRVPLGEIEIGPKGQNKTATTEDNKSSPK